MSRSARRLETAAALAEQLRKPRRVILGGDRRLEVEASLVPGAAWAGSPRFNIAVRLHRGGARSPVRLEFPARALRQIIEQLEGIERDLAGGAP